MMEWGIAKDEVRSTEGEAGLIRDRRQGFTAIASWRSQVVSVSRRMHKQSAVNCREHGRGAGSKSP